MMGYVFTYLKAQTLKLQPSEITADQLDEMSYSETVEVIYSDSEVTVSLS